MYNRATGKEGQPTLFYDDEKKVAISVKGVRAARNNNPGNIEYGNFTKTFGAIGTDGRFAIFPDSETGFNCMKKLLSTSKNYAGKTIKEIVLKYAPPFENNVEQYIKAIEKNTGFKRDFVPVFEVDFLKLCKGMAEHEGFYNSKLTIEKIEWKEG